MSKKQISVQAHHTYINKMAAIIDSLQQAGMTIEDKIESIGHFKGFADENKIDDLKKIPGISSVKVLGNKGDEEQKDYSISK